MKPDQPAAATNHAFQSVKDVEAHAKTRMDKVISGLQHEMTAIRTGRASVAIFDNLRVDYYGTPTPLNQVANLHVPEPSLITIQPWDVSQIAVISLGPQMAVFGGVNQLNRDGHTISRACDCSLDNGFHTKLPRDLIDWFAGFFISHHRGPRDDAHRK